MSIDERRRASVGPRTLKPFGSTEWCWQTANSLQTLTGNLEANWQDVRTLLAELERAEAWTKIPPEHPYGSFEALVRAETGHRLDRIRADIRSYESIAPLGKHGNNQYSGGDNITSTSRGTEATYLVARLKRDHPELAKRVIDGELSPNAAAIEAGFRHRMATVPIDDVCALAKALTRRLTACELLELRELLTDG